MSSRGEQHYTGTSGRHYHEGKRALPPRALPWVTRLRAAKLSPFVHETDAVFEFGVGSGWNLASLCCRRKAGCDISEFLQERLREHGIEYVRDPSWLEDFSVDVAICHHSLEHVAAPLDVLIQIRRLLCANGKLLLHVPYEKEARYRRFDPQEPNHHLYSWNVQTLGNLVTEAGFNVVSAGLGEFGYDRFAAHWAVRLRLGEFGFRMIRRLLHLLRPMREVRIVATKAADPASVKPESLLQRRRERRSDGNRDQRAGRSAFRGRSREGEGSSR